jgi:hypothetical protein
MRIVEAGRAASRWSRAEPFNSIQTIATRKAGTTAMQWRLIVFWSPRILALVFAVFMSLFALDVFNERLGLWRTLAALLFHLIPTAIVLVILAVSWRWGIVGTVLFSALGAHYIFSTRGQMHWSAYAVIAGPLFLLALLFLVDWLTRVRLRPN